LAAVVNLTYTGKKKSEIQEWFELSGYRCN